MVFYIYIYSIYIFLSLYSLLAQVVKLMNTEN